MATPFFFRIDFDFRITAPQFTLTVKPHSEERIYYSCKGSDFTLCLPQHFNFTDPRYQLFLNETLVAMLRRRAQAYLPPLVHKTACGHNLRYNRVFIKNVRTRWGSCSSLGNINLSLWLMLLPEDLILYVVKHELAHLNEMNHSTRFWQEVDKLCDGPGTGYALEQRLRQYAVALSRLPNDIIRQKPA